MKKTTRITIGGALIIAIAAIVTISVTVNQINPDNTPSKKINCDVYLQGSDQASGNNTRAIVQDNIQEQTKRDYNKENQTGSDKAFQQLSYDLIEIYHIHRAQTCTGYNLTKERHQSFIHGDKVQVSGTLTNTKNTNQTRERIERIGGDRISVYSTAFVAQIPINNIIQLATIPEIHYVRTPSQAYALDNQV